MSYRSVLTANGKGQEKCGSVAALPGHPFWGYFLASMIYDSVISGKVLAYPSYCRIPYGRRPALYTVRKRYVTVWLALFNRNLKPAFAAGIENELS